MAPSLARRARRCRSPHPKLVRPDAGLAVARGREISGGRSWQVQALDRLVACGALRFYCRRQWPRPSICRHCLAARSRANSATLGSVMRSRPGILAEQFGLTTSLGVVGLTGCALAVMLGALGATRYGLLVAGAILGLAFAGVAIATYVKDPVLALIGLWLFEVFNAPLSAAVGYSSHIGELIRQGDEVLVLLFVALTIWRTLRTNVSLAPLLLAVLACGVALCGLLGAVVHGVPLTVTAVGTLLGLKLWIIVAVTLVLPWRATDVTRVYSAVTRVGVLVAVVGLADYLTHGAVSRALHTTIYNFRASTYRSSAVQSIFPSPGEYSLFMSLLFGLTFARFASKSRRSDLALALLFAGSAVLSLRLKGVLSLATVIVIVGIVQGMGNRRRAIAVLAVGVVVLGGAFSIEGSVIAKQISTYTSSETTARARLYAVGEQIASDDFPLGVGFGRFASYPSRIYYSPVYYQYRLSRVYGLSPTYPHFIDDTSWPSVIGETGYGGFAFYVVGLAVLICAICRRLRRTTAEMRWLPLAALCAIAVLLVDSLGDSSLFSWPDTTNVALVLGPALIATPLAAKISRRRPADGAV